MSVIWLGDEIKTEIRKYVLDELGISSKKLENEVARKAILFVLRFQRKEFRKAWKEGKLET